MTLLTREIRDASAVITPGYQPVTLVTKDGQRIRGARKNEDAYSIQIMDTRERLQGYVKADLREVIAEKTSLMPDFKADRLSDSDLDDVVGYLEHAARRQCTCRPSRRRPGGPEGPGCVTTQDLLDGLKNPARWLQYSGDYTGQRHSPLTQITPQNVNRLTPQWTFQADTIATGRGFEVDAARRRRRDLPDRCRTATRGRSTRAPAVSSGASAVRTLRTSRPAPTYPVNRGFAALGNQSVHDDARRARPRRST